jgi:ribosome-associated toxin RatA of RatAB toxin-antitoxin module
MAETEQNGGGNGNGSAQTVMSTLKSKELLVPAALSAAGAIVAAKAPDLIHKLTETAEEKGEDEAEELGEKAAEGAKKSMSGGKSGLVGKAISKAMPGGGGGESGGGGGGEKKTRRLPIQRWTDVAVPVEKAYEAWNDFDQYPKFMHRVLNVRQKGDDKVQWQEKVWFSSRQWEGRITERRKNDRIAWKTTSGMSHRGVVTFHSLGDNLTRVMVDMEFEPTGMIEKMASGLRFVKRAVQADLARFKAYVEMEDAKGIEYRSGKKEDEDREDGRRDREQARKERRESAKAS